MKGECTAGYSYASRELGSKMDQKVEHFYHLVRGSARRLYRRNITRKGLIFHHISMMMDEEYDSLFTKNRRVAYLRSLRINKFMTTNRNSVESLE